VVEDKINLPRFLDAFMKTTSKEGEGGYSVVTEFKKGDTWERNTRLRGEDAVESQKKEFDRRESARPTLRRVI